MRKFHDYITIMIVIVLSLMSCVICVFAEVKSEPEYDAEKNIFYANYSSVVFDAPSDSEYAEGFAVIAHYGERSWKIKPNSLVYIGSKYQPSVVHMDETEVVINGGSIGTVYIDDENSSESSHTIIKGDEAGLALNIVVNGGNINKIITVKNSMEMAGVVRLGKESTGEVGTILLGSEDGYLGKLNDFFVFDERDAHSSSISIELGCFAGNHISSRTMKYGVLQYWFDGSNFVFPDGFDRLPHVVINRTFINRYNPCGGRFPDYENTTDSIVVRHDYDNIPSVERDGYEFNGWTGYNVLYDDQDDYGDGYNLYAKWIPINDTKPRVDYPGGVYYYSNTAVGNIVDLEISDECMNDGEYITPLTIKYNTYNQDDISEVCEEWSCIGGKFYKDGVVDEISWHRESNSHYVYKVNCYSRDGTQADEYVFSMRVLPSNDYGEYWGAMAYLFDDGKYMGSTCCEKECLKSDIIIPSNTTSIILVPFGVPDEVATYREENDTWDEENYTRIDVNWNTDKAIDVKKGVAIAEYDYFDANSQKEVYHVEIRFVAIDEKFNDFQNDVYRNLYKIDTSRKIIELAKPSLLNIDDYEDQLFLLDFQGSDNIIKNTIRELTDEYSAYGDIVTYKEAHFYLDKECVHPVDVQSIKVGEQYYLRIAGVYSYGLERDDFGNVKRDLWGECYSSPIPIKFVYTDEVDEEAIEQIKKNVSKYSGKYSVEYSDLSRIDIAINSSDMLLPSSKDAEESFRLSKPELYNDLVGDTNLCVKLFTDSAGRFGDDILDDCMTSWLVYYVDDVYYYTNPEYCRGKMYVKSIIYVDNDSDDYKTSAENRIKDYLGSDYDVSVRQIDSGKELLLEIKDLLYTFGDIPRAASCLEIKKAIRAAKAAYITEGGLAMYNSDTETKKENFLCTYPIGDEILEDIQRGKIEINEGCSLEYVEDALKNALKDGHRNSYKLYKVVIKKEETQHTVSGLYIIEKDAPICIHTYNQNVISDEFLKVPATCTDDAVYYRSCKCGLKGKSTFIASGTATGHKMTYVGPVSPTALSPGNFEYWICDICKKYFKDADGNTEYLEGSWMIPAIGGEDSGGGTVVPTEPTEPEREVIVNPINGNIVVNLSGDTKVAEGTASTVISKETAAEIAKSITENKSTEVIFDATVKRLVDKTELAIPVVIVESADTNGASVEIATNVGSVVLDKQTVKGLAKMDADSITVTVEKTEESSEIKTIFEIALSAVKDGKSTTISKLQGTAQIVAPLPSGIKAEEACGLYLNGKLAEKVTTKVDGKNVVLTVKHFSTYGVMSNAEANKLFKASAEATTMGKLTLKAYKGGKIKASWKNGSGNTSDITKYQVYYKQSGKNAKYTTTTSKSKTIKKLKKGKTYTVKARAYIKINGKTYKSKWTSVKKIKCK